MSEPLIPRAVNPDVGNPPPRLFPRQDTTNASGTPDVPLVDPRQEAWLILSANEPTSESRPGARRGHPGLTALPEASADKGGSDVWREANMPADTSGQPDERGKGVPRRTVDLPREPDKSKTEGTAGAPEGFVGGTTGGVPLSVFQPGFKETIRGISGKTDLKCSADAKKISIEDATDSNFGFHASMLPDQSDLVEFTIRNQGWQGDPEDKHPDIYPRLLREEAMRYLGMQGHKINGIAALLVHKPGGTMEDEYEQYNQYLESLEREGRSITDDDKKEAASKTVIGVFALSKGFTEVTVEEPFPGLNGKEVAIFSLTFRKPQPAVDEQPETTGGSVIKPPTEPPGEAPEVRFDKRGNPKPERLSLPRQRVNQERLVLSSGGAGDTFRTVHDEIFVASGINMVDELSGRKIVDMGSGYGGIAQTAHHLGVDTEITSVNPRLRLPAQKRALREDSPYFLRIHYPDITDEQIAVAIAHHNRRVSTNFAHALTDLKTGSADRILDVVAVHTHMKEVNEELYQLSIEEMLRVLRFGGDILVVDGFSNAVGNRDERTGEMGMKERVLRRMGVNYMPIIKDPDSEFQPAVGVRIFK